MTNQDRISRLRDAMDRAGFDNDHVTPLLGDSGLPAPRSTSFGRLQHRAGSDSDLHTLIRFFILGLPVSSKRMNAILAPITSGDLQALELARVDGDRVEPLVAMLPQNRWLLAFDHPGKVKLGAPADLVMSVTGSSLGVANFAVNRKSTATLDLGTGNGLLALQAAGWSEQVT